MCFLCQASLLASVFATFARIKVSRYLEATMVAQIITLVAVAFSLVMLLITFWQLTRETRLSTLAPVLAIATPLLTTLVYVFVTSASVNWLTAGVLAAIGFLVGLGLGQTTQLYYRGRLIYGKRNAGYLVLWGLAFIFTVALAQTGSGLLHAGGILIMMFGVGTAVGANLVLLFKQLILKPQPMTPPVAFYGTPRPPTGLPK
jgi:hypothetical protein